MVFILTFTKTEHLFSVNGDFFFFFAHTRTEKLVTSGITLGWLMPQNFGARLHCFKCCISFVAVAGIRDGHRPVRLASGVLKKELKRILLILLFKYCRFNVITQIFASI